MNDKMYINMFLAIVDGKTRMPIWIENWEHTLCKVELTSEEEYDEVNSFLLLLSLSWITGIRFFVMTTSIIKVHVFIDFILLKISEQLTPYVWVTETCQNFIRSSETTV